MPGGYQAVRDRTEQLAARLGPEDQVVQSMPDCSPAKWHRGHTTWFFEEFVLGPHAGVAPHRPEYQYLFNSYYESVGPRQPRHRRGMLTRPTVEEVGAYRRVVDEAMGTYLASGAAGPAVLDLVELGCHHEEQHQELLLMDAKHLLFQNPLRPAYQPAAPLPTVIDVVSWGWIDHPGGVVEIGHDGHGFAFDNESPRHEVLLRPFAVADRAVTAGEWLAFMADGGYQRPELWLSDGWHTAVEQGWDAPLYWEPEADAPDGWTVFTLGGVRPVDLAEAVAHVSYYEADAYARWAGHRLPTEAEWEAIAHKSGEGAVVANDLRSGRLHPGPAPRAEPGIARQLWGDVWEWTSSSYSAYPGFRPAAGAVGEYNGKFMVNQQVLRGGACVTPGGHARLSYRNFYPPSARWAFAGVRVADDLGRKG